ncbi:STAS domain-containing protein [Sphaerisporangium corydalis]|uniref:STAS domain-containing protein n=1 Tax=Sphaerisporangium corydalis TaxID=1441875 RepID=A0ABV9E8R5_9ACTN|nr:STAS domain-containing protein [Sphaerisporangium corydalis]
MDLESDGASLSVRRIADPPGLRVGGEVDTTTAGEFGEALAAVVRCCDGDVRVDLAGVTFIDLAGLRVLADTAAELGPGRALVLGPMAGHVEHLIRLVGWDTAPGLRLAG